MTPQDRIEMVQQLSDQWKVFPNLSDLAAYEPISQTIHLYGVSNGEFNAAVEQKGYAAKKKVLPLLHHELTHWTDHITTLWGIEYLIKLFNAINARRNETETDLWRVVEFERMTKRHHHAEYYTIIYPKGYEPHDGIPWRW